MKISKYAKLSASMLSVVMLQSATLGFMPSAVAIEHQEDGYLYDNVSCSFISDDYLSLDNIPDTLMSTLGDRINNATKLDEDVYYDVFSIGTLNEDGTKSLIFFNQPIKYYDEATNSMLFIDNEFSSLESNNGLMYVSKGNSYHVNLSENISEGLNITYDDYALNMKPLTSACNEKPVIKDNELQYEKAFDDSTILCYALENSGIKESIVVNEPNGITTYDFVFSSNGLTPLNKSGDSITFIDESTGEEVYIVQPTYIIDSYDGDYVEGEDHITYKNYYEVEDLSDGTYLIHMILDEEFLNSETTVYPCVIDPSIWAATFTNDSSSYVMQSGGTAYINNQLSAGGFNGSGEHISYVKPNSVDKLKWIEPDRIQSVSFNVKDTSSAYSNACKINLYDSTTNSSVSNVTYSELTSSLGALQSSSTFTTLGASYSFDVTNLFRQWIKYSLGEGGKDSKYGFILRGVPNESTPGRWFSSTSSSNTFFDIVYEEGEEIEDGFYNIRNASTGTYLCYNSGGQLYLSSSSASNACKWQAILKKSLDGETTYGVYTLSPYNDLNVSVKGTSTGSAVTTNASGNVFRIIRNADNTFRIMPTDYASVSNAIGISSNNATIQEYSNISTMKWTFEPVVNKYFSEYSPDSFNDTTSDYPTQYRMNCYGYAYRHILYYEDYSRYYSRYYKQQPGEFCTTSYKPQSTCIISNDPVENMDMVVYNMKLDARRFGYSMTEYIPTGSTVNQYGANSRLIAVVTGVDDYHFYMQHNDGTWSHKPGSTEVRNRSISSTVSNPVYLTNSNIQTLANQGAYSNGELKFFIITRDAVEDHPHGIRSNYTETTLYYKDIAGDNMFNSASITVSTKEACFDYYDDVDYYVFTPSSSRIYTLTTDCEMGYDIDGAIYDYNGNLIASATNVGQINKSFSAISGKRYFIKIYNYSHSPGEYTLTIS